MQREDDEFERIIDAEFDFASEYPYDPKKVHSARHPSNRLRMETVGRAIPQQWLDEDSIDWLDWVTGDARRFLSGREVLHFETICDEAIIGWRAVLTRVAHVEN